MTTFIINLLNLHSTQLMLPDLHSAQLMLPSRNDLGVLNNINNDVLFLYIERAFNFHSILFKTTINDRMNINRSVFKIHCLGKKVDTNGRLKYNKLKLALLSI